MMATPTSHTNHLIHRSVFVVRIGRRVLGSERIIRRVKLSLKI